MTGLLAGTQLLQHLFDHRDLRGQRGRGLFGAVGGQPVRLVGGDHRNPEGRPPVRVQAGDQPGGMPGPDQPADGVEQAAHRVHRRAVRGPDGLRHPEERPVVQRRGIKQHQRTHPAILPVPVRGGDLRRYNNTTLPSMILICFFGSGLGAGPVTTAPVVILNSLPWQGQSMVPLATSLTMQPTCVHTALNPWY